MVGKRDLTNTSIFALGVQPHWRHTDSRELAELKRVNARRVSNIETCFEYLGENDYGTFFTDESFWVRRIEKLAAEHPEDVQIVTRNKDGSIIAHLPKKWMRIAPPRVMSEAQKEVIAAMNQRKALARSENA